jgi:hypothetical protein
MFFSSVAGFRLEPYIRVMEHGAFKEESRRFAVALAAAEVGGRKISMIDGPLDPERRAYFYATPEKEGRFGVEKLSSLIQKDDCPVLVDWDRTSEFYGLRYTVKDRPIRSELREYQGEKAKADWSAWRTREKSVTRIVSLAAQEAGKGKPLTFLDTEPESIPDRSQRKNDLEL